MEKMYFGAPAIPSTIPLLVGQPFGIMEENAHKPSLGTTLAKSKARTSQKVS
jgi:hypothetical protein